MIGGAFKDVRLPAHFCPQRGVLTLAKRLQSAELLSLPPLLLVMLCHQLLQFTPQISVGHFLFIQLAGQPLHLLVQQGNLPLLVVNPSGPQVVGTPVDQACGPDQAQYIDPDARAFDLRTSSAPDYALLLWRQDRR